MVVYFGPMEDVALGKKAEMHLQAAIADRYRFDMTRVWFYQIDDAECRKSIKYNDTDSDIIVLYNRKMTPKVLELAQVDTNTILQMSTIRYVQANPVWN